MCAARARPRRGSERRPPHAATDAPCTPGRSADPLRRRSGLDAEHVGLGRVRSPWREPHDVVVDALDPDGRAARGRSRSAPPIVTRRRPSASTVVDEPPVGEPARYAVDQLHPGRVGLLLDERRGTRRVVHLEQTRRALVARLHADRQRRAGRPIDVGQVFERARDPIAPRPARPVATSKTCSVTIALSVPARGYRIALGSARGVGGVGDPHDADGALVDASGGELRPVGREPVTAQPVHLLGGGEVGDAPRDVGVVVACEHPAAHRRRPGRATRRRRRRPRATRRGSAAGRTARPEPAAPGRRRR